SNVLRGTVRQNHLRRAVHLWSRLPPLSTPGPLKAQPGLGVGLGWRCKVAILECIQIYNLRVFPELNTWVKIIFKEKLNEILPFFQEESFSYRGHWFHRWMADQKIG
ncbi:hypothetical protein N9D61_09970, partial [Planktomarina sp.]|nr:hypothetical protein [Planktomarina sp.]